MITIRPLEQADIMGVAQVNIETWQHAYANIVDATYLADMSIEKSLAKWEKIFKENQNNSQKHAVVAINKQGQIVGFASVEISTDTSKWASQLTTLYVLPDWHKQGVGKALLAASKDWALEQNANTIGLWVFTNNKTAIDFYLKQGFTKTTHTQNKVIGTQTHVLDGYLSVTL